MDGVRPHDFTLLGNLVSCFTEDMLVSMFGVTVNNNQVDECSVFVTVVCLRDLESSNFDLLPK